MRKTGIAANLIFVAAWGWAGCDDSSGIGAADAGEADGAVVAGACHTPDDLVAASPICTRLENVGSPIAFTLRSNQEPPTMQGGTLVDGTYVVIKHEGYRPLGGTVDDAGRRATIAVFGGGTRFMWAVELLDFRGELVAGAFTADTTVTAGPGEHLLNFAPTCTSRPGSVPVVMSYTSTRTEIVLEYSDATGSTYATTFGRIGCP